MRVVDNVLKNRRNVSSAVAKLRKNRMCRISPCIIFFFLYNIRLGATKMLRSYVLSPVCAMLLLGMILEIVSREEIKMICLFCLFAIISYLSSKET